jgi:hypothetical protein
MHSDHSFLHFLVSCSDYFTFFHDWNKKNCKKTRFWELLLPKSRLFIQQALTTHSVALVLISMGGWGGIHQNFPLLVLNICAFWTMFQGSVYYFLKVFTFLKVLILPLFIITRINHCWRQGKKNTTRLRNTVEAAWCNHFGPD